jgi:hypothetical protein
MNFMGKLALIALIACAANAYKDPLVEPGRTVMVHLFEWKWPE